MNRKKHINTKGTREACFFYDQIASIALIETNDCGKFLFVGS